MIRTRTSVSPTPQLFRSTAKGACAAWGGTLVGCGREWFQLPSSHPLANCEAASALSLAPPWKLSGFTRDQLRLNRDRRMSRPFARRQPGSQKRLCLPRRGGGRGAVGQRGQGEEGRRKREARADYTDSARGPSERERPCALMSSPFGNMAWLRHQAGRVAPRPKRHRRSSRSCTTAGRSLSCCRYSSPSLTQCPPGEHPSCVTGPLVNRALAFRRSGGPLLSMSMAAFSPTARFEPTGSPPRLAASPKPCGRYSGMPSSTPPFRRKSRIGHAGRTSIASLGTKDSTKGSAPLTVC